MSKIKINLVADIVLKDGQKRLAFKNPDYYRDQVNRLDDRRKVLVTIKNVTSTRSNRQNAYLHAVCFPCIAELTGYTTAEAKEVCKKMFITPKILNVNGVEYEVQRGTSELTKYEGVEFITAVRNLAVELGGYCPSSEDAGYMTENTEIDERKIPEYDDNCPTPLI